MPFRLGTVRARSRDFIFAPATVMVFFAGVCLAATTAFSAIAPGPFGSASRLLTPNSVIERTSPERTASPAPTALAIKTNARPSTFSCADLRRAALKMSAHASNMANRQTSRTPDGGPYRRLEVVCRAAGGAFCNVEKVSEEKTVYQPGHPDADQNGYVKLPVIDMGSESAGLNTAATELKLISSQGVCGAKTIEQGPLTVVKYNPDFDVMMDTMTFAPDGKVTRWSRTTRDGKTQNISFKDDGTPVSL